MLHHRRHRCYFGIITYFVIRSAQSAARLWRRCVRVCLYEAVLGRCYGGPWGEAGQSLPVAAPGQGMAIQDTCLGLQPKLMATASLRPISTSRSRMSSSGDVDPPLTSPSLQVPRCLFHFIACPPFFQQFVYPLPPFLRSYTPPSPPRLSLTANVSPPSFSLRIQYFGEVVFLH